MTIDNRGAVTVADEDRTLLQALRRNKDIFKRHPELLEGLDLPHIAGGATSLIEYQVRQLRVRNSKLQRTLKTLMSNARTNESLSARMHQLCVSLLAAQNVVDALGQVYGATQDSFNADLTAIRLYCAAPPGERGCGEFVGRDGASSVTIDECIAHAKPVCGMLGDDTLQLLFKERAGEAGSCALVALNGVRWRGVLALAAKDPKRFGPNVGTIFLVQLGELVSHALLRAQNGY